jgi:hypothetical protein
MNGPIDLQYEVWLEAKRLLIGCKYSMPCKYGNPPTETPCGYFRVRMKVQYCVKYEVYFGE